MQQNHLHNQRFSNPKITIAYLKYEINYEIVCILQKSKKDATFKSRPEESSTSAQRVPIAHVVVVVPTPSVESVAQVPPQSNQSSQCDLL